MNQAEQEEQLSHSITLPIEWHVPDTIQNRYVQNVIVQPGNNEITIFFFEMQIPPYAGAPETNRAYLLQQGSVRCECVGKITVVPQLVPEMIKALQNGLDAYNASKASEEKRGK